MFGKIPSHAVRNINKGSSISKLVRQNDTTRQQMRGFALVPAEPPAADNNKNAARQHSGQGQPVVRLLPHIPPEFAKKPKQFVGDDRKMKAMLDLIFSPHSPKDDLQDRRRYERERRRYLLALERERSKFMEQKRQLEESTYNAIRHLPAELYDEAVRSDNEPLHETRKEDIHPQQLLFHQMYKDQIFDSLTRRERKQLQVFQNLMQIRFGHAEMRKKDPEKFWIPETQFVSRQRENALNRHKLKKA